MVHKMKLIDSYSKLLPYDGTVYSPVKRPPRIGELAVTLSDPRGYCCIVKDISNDVATVYWLDDLPNATRTYPLKSLIPTGKTPLDLLKLYEPTPQSLNEALTKERSQVDYLAFKKKGGGSATKKPKFDVKNMSKEQKDQLKGFIMQLLKGGDK